MPLLHVHLNNKFDAFAKHSADVVPVMSVKQDTQGVAGFHHRAGYSKPIGSPGHEPNGPQNRFAKWTRVHIVIPGQNRIIDHSAG